MEKQSKYKQENEIETTIDAEWLVEQVVYIIYNQGKAKILNLLESQLEDNTKLYACKRLAEGLISDIAKNAGNLIKDTLTDWEEKVLIPTESGLSEEEEEEARKEYEEVEKVMGIKRHRHDPELTA